MFIITRHEVSESQRRALSRLLGREVDREQLRAFLQQQGQQALDDVTRPLVADRKPARRHYTTFGA